MSVQTSGWSCRRARPPCLAFGARIDPAAMHPAVDRIGRLRIDIALAHQAAERRLDVAGRAAEPVVQIEVAEGGIEIVAPEQAHHATSKPQAFRIGGRSAENPLGLGEFVDLLWLPWLRPACGLSCPPAFAPRSGRVPDRRTKKHRRAKAAATTRILMRRMIPRCVGPYGRRSPLPCGPESVSIAAAAAPATPPD